MGGGGGGGIIPPNTRTESTFIVFLRRTIYVLCFVPQIDFGRFACSCNTHFSNALHLCRYCKVTANMIVASDSYSSISIIRAMQRMTACIG